MRAVSTFLVERYTSRSLILSHECHYSRESDVPQPYGAAMYDLDSSLYDNDDSENVGRSIAAFPEGAEAIDKRGAAYSQWRKNGKRSQVRTEMG